MYQTRLVFRIRKVIQWIKFPSNFCDTWSKRYLSLGDFQRTQSYMSFFWHGVYCGLGLNNIRAWILQSIFIVAYSWQTWVMRGGVDWLVFNRKHIAVYSTWSLSLRCVYLYDLGCKDLRIRNLSTPANQQETREITITFTLPKFLKVV